MPLLDSKACVLKSEGCMKSETTEQLVREEENAIGIWIVWVGLVMQRTGTEATGIEMC
jgi:hypothetical protein